MILALATLHRLLTRGFRCKCNGFTRGVVGAGVVGLFCSTPMLADEPQEITLEKLAALKLQTIAAREKLVSGEFWVEGKQIISHERATYENKIRFRVVFDYLSNLYLFDYRLTTPGGRVLHSIMARSADKSMAFADIRGGPQIRLNYPDAEVRFDFDQQVRNFDPRLVGFFDYHQHTNVGNLNERLDVEFGITSDQDTVTLRDDAEGLLVLESYYYSLKHPTAIKRWVDPNMEYSLARYEFWLKASVDEEGKPVAENLHTVNEADWEKRDGVAVPIRYFMSTTGWTIPTIEQKKEGWPDNLTEKRTLELNFKWVHVNSLPSEDCFDYRSFGLPVGTHVWDDRLSPPAMVEIISTETASPIARLPVDRMKFFWWTAAAVAVLISGCYYVISRRRRAFQAS